MDDYHAAFDEAPRPQVTTLRLGWLTWVALAGVLALGGLAWYAKDHLAVGKKPEPQAGTAGLNGSRPHLRLKPEPYTSEPAVLSPVAADHGVPLPDRRPVDTPRPKPAMPQVRPVTPPTPPPAPKTPKRRQALLSSPRTIEAAEVASHGVPGGLVLAPLTAISGVVEFDVNTDLPGLVRVRVTGDVFDSATMRTVLIPQYATLGVRYGQRPLKYGEERVPAAVEFMIVRDRTVQVKGFGSDPMGTSGWGGEVTTHFWRAVGASLVSAAGRGSVQSVMGMGVGMGGSPLTAMGGAVAQGGERMVGRSMEPWTSIAPTITKKGGERVTIVLEEALTLPPYQEGRDAGR